MINDDKKNDENLCQKNSPEMNQLKIIDALKRRVEMYELRNADLIRERDDLDNRRIDATEKCEDWRRKYYALLVEVEGKTQYSETKIGCQQQRQRVTECEK